MTAVTVLLCCYNDDDVLSGAIRSVLRQTLPNSEYEFLIVDDGSTDRTPDVIELFASSDLVRAVRNETNQGLVASVNRGISLSGGEYIVRLDADDAFAPSAIERLLEVAQSTDAAFVYSDRYEVDRETGTVRYVDTGGDFDVFDLIAIGTLWRADVTRDIDGFRGLFWEEYDFYIRYLDACSGTTEHVSIPLCVYLQHGDSMTADVDRVREGWAELLDRWGEETLKRYGTLPPDITTYES